MQRYSFITFIVADNRWLDSELAICWILWVCPIGLFDFCIKIFNLWVFCKWVAWSPRCIHQRHKYLKVDSFVNRIKSMSNHPSYQRSNLQVLVLLKNLILAFQTINSVMISVFHVNQKTNPFVFRKLSKVNL